MVADQLLCSRFMKNARLSDRAFFMGHLAPGLILFFLFLIAWAILAWFFALAAFFLAHSVLLA